MTSSGFGKNEKNEGACVCWGGGGGGAGGGGSPRGQILVN